MLRTTTTDGGSRYLVTLPFARELSAEECDSLEEAFATTAFDHRHEYGTDAIDTRDVDVTAEAARVTVALPFDADHDPGEVLGQLSRAVSEWHSREGPLGEATRAGGEQSLTSLDAATLDVDQEPAASDAGPYTYLLVYPDRPLTDEEVALLEHVTDDMAVVTRSFVAFVDAASLVYGSPGDRTLQDIHAALRGHVPADHDLRTRGFFGTREVGTLAAADDQAREALRHRGRQETPITTDSDAAESTA